MLGWRRSILLRLLRFLAEHHNKENSSHKHHKQSNCDKLIGGHFSIRRRRRRRRRINGTFGATRTSAAAAASLKSRTSASNGGFLGSSDRSGKSIDGCRGSTHGIVRNSRRRRRIRLFSLGIALLLNRNIPKSVSIALSSQFAAANRDIRAGLTLGITRHKSLSEASSAVTGRFFETQSLGFSGILGAVLE